MSTSNPATARSARTDPSAPARSTSPAEDLIAALLGVWLMAGTTIDGWAHSNLLADLQEESFFTPWHGVLYSGFTATAAWTFWLGYRRRHTTARWWVDGWPTGYRVGALGVAIFFAGGLADMVWHELLGVEVSIDAVLSPSHLVLAVGAVLLLTSPTRSWWASGEGGHRAVAGLVALAMGTTAVAVFTLYASAFDVVGAISPYDGTPGSIGFTTASLGVASYLVSTVVIVLPLLLVHRRRPTPGVATALVTPVALFPALVYELPRPHTAGALGAIAAALLADWILVRLDASRGRDAPLRLSVAGAVVAGLVSSGHLLALHLADGVLWPPELWTGTVVTAAAVGALLGGLAQPPRTAVGHG